MQLFHARARRRTDDEILDGLDNPGTRPHPGQPLETSCASEIELLQRRAHRAPSTARPSSRASRPRCSSARRSTTSACARCSTRWCELAPPPRARAGRGARVVEPEEAKFTGFVFKIQANMDPAPPRPHRLRARLLGHVRARHEAAARSRPARTVAINNAITFMAQRPRRNSRKPTRATSSACRTTARSSLGDVFTEGESTAVHRHSVIRAGVLPPRAAEQPAQGQAVAEGPAAAGRRGRDADVPPAGVERSGARRGRHPAVRRGGAPAGARVRGRCDLRIA